ncbi:DNA primase [Baekduia sp. Peel2402]|uniref:DNA primase n=1 Tax=Baekduia sp. Peel2402 TaxID=3458296 RepID=UPI00403EC9E9
MPRYAEDSKEKVRDATDMVALVEARTDVRRSGPGQYMARCVFHDERTASMSVDADKKLFHCFGCGAAGDVFKFVMDTEGLDFVGAMESLAQRFGVQLMVEDEDPAALERRQRRERLLELLERAASYYERLLWESDEAAPARKYLLDRGLTEETLRTFRVGYAPSAWDTLMMTAHRGGFTHRELYDAGLVTRGQKGQGRLYDRFRRRITFPLQDARGRVLGFGARALGADQQPKYLNSPDGDIFHKGDIVYAAHHARFAAAKADEVIACEGYMDVLALHQAGMENAVCIMGTSLTDRQVGELAKLAKTVLLALDADSAGQEAMLRAAKVAAGSRVSLRVVPLPEGLDPADVVQQRGVDAARAMVKESVPFVRFQIERELDQADLSHAEGKDAAIAALRPVFATLPPSALREELLALTADRLDLQPSMVSSWLAVTEELPADAGAGGWSGGDSWSDGGASGGWDGADSGWGSGGAGSGGRRDGGRGGFGGRGGGGGGGFGGGPRHDVPAPPIPQDPSARAERALLAYCVAAGAEGLATLQRLSAEAFSDELARSAAEHLRDNWDAPADAFTEDADPRLRSLVTGIIVRGGAEPLTRAGLQSQLARVELAHINRQITAARAAGEPVATLVVQRTAANERLQAHLAERIDESIVL